MHAPLVASPGQVEDGRRQGKAQRERFSCSVLPSGVSCALPRVSYPFCDPAFTVSPPFLCSAALSLSQLFCFSFCRPVGRFLWRAGPMPVAARLSISPSFTVVRRLLIYAQHCGDLASHYGACFRLKPRKRSSVTVVVGRQGGRSIVASYPQEIPGAALFHSFRAVKTRWKVADGSRTITDDLFRVQRCRPGMLPTCRSDRLA
jgi:hypothetical protein